MFNKKYLGIEFGSTRIKAVLIDEKFTPIASGAYNWENQLEGGYWTYALENVWTGVQSAYRELAADFESKYGEKLNQLDGIGISAMMHGYLAFDANDQLLVPFRTWRNTTTEQAAEILTEKFSFNIPQRWSIAHYYQAYLNKEEHLGSVAFLTTLAGYVHYKLTGEKVLGVGDASGVFPIDSSKVDFDNTMLNLFHDLTGCNFKTILPKVLGAGEAAGNLTTEGALLLDPLL